ncbi:prepilin peptidase [Paenibacillus oralis]|uniref:Prepilin peptidase n=1 Tax=Paenibacillus oralis TaxID=2490856 RepID=A0A3P3U1U6_9BACL|nr:A24 family peptidase [Paenibacillus oralis]RRJ63578.1 prepilin peptidase [Paenibacillus oralis]
METIMLAALNFIAGLAAGAGLARLGRRLVARRGLLPAGGSGVGGSSVGGSGAGGGGVGGSGAGGSGADGSSVGGSGSARVSAAAAAGGTAPAAGAAPSGRLRRAGDIAAAFATAAMFALMHLRFGASGAWAVGLLLTALAVLIAVTDLTARIIPNGALLCFGAALLAAVPLAGGGPLWSHALGALGGSGLLLLIAAIAPGRGMGMGDIKLLAVFGWAVGFPGVLLALLAAAVTGAAAILLQHAFGRRQRGQTLAFGPYLAFGTLLVYLYGNEIIHWYAANAVFSG